MRAGRQQHDVRIELRTSSSVVTTTRWPATVGASSRADPAMTCTPSAASRSRDVVGLGLRKGPDRALTRASTVDRPASPCSGKTAGTAVEADAEARR